jgi:hypothetical protein
MVTPLPDRPAPTAGLSSKLDKRLGAQPIGVKHALQKPLSGLAHLHLSVQNVNVITMSNM